MKKMRTLYKAMYSMDYIHSHYGLIPYEDFLCRERDRLILSGQRAELRFHPGQFVSLLAEWDTEWDVASIYYNRHGRKSKGGKANGDTGNVDDQGVADVVGSERDDKVDQENRRKA